MSFRARLTSFFVLIVVLPMIAIGCLVFRLIGQSDQGKADARASGLATAAASIYQSDSAAARADAASIGRAIANLHGTALTARARSLATRSGLARVTISSGPTALLDIGSRSAVAPGVAQVEPGRAGGQRLTMTASELTAAGFARELFGSGVAVVVRQGSNTLGSTLPAAAAEQLPSEGTISSDGADYRVLTQRFPGFGHAPVDVTVLSNVATTASSAGPNRLLAAVFIAVFLLLAAAFAVLASRGLQSQLGEFLQAARRLGGGDLSARVLTEGQDEFAALGQQFNKMSDELARRIDELGQERARLREAIHRIGETFASNLDRTALLELALRTTVDAVQADCGRLCTRLTAEDSLSQAVAIGSLRGLTDQLLAAERAALAARGLGEAGTDEVSVAAATLEPFKSEGPAHGLITVGRRRGGSTTTTATCSGRSPRRRRSRLRTSSYMCRPSARRSPMSSPGSRTTVASRSC